MPPQPNSLTDPRHITNEAWIGDAVLSLYARMKILREEGALDGDKCIRLTSNKFLGSVGEPTRIEAEIGRRFEREGLTGAFAWIEEHLVPMFERQEQNRSRKPARR
ncbi:MAG TPA: ribonuclease III domain-containing protein [Bryobacteraceae bacterium]